jgi:hypothetical protein
MADVVEVMCLRMRFRLLDEMSEYKDICPILLGLLILSEEQVNGRVAA